MTYLTFSIAGLILIVGWLFVEIKLNLAYRLMYGMIAFLICLIALSGLWYQEIIEERFRIQKNEIAFLDAITQTIEEESAASVLSRLKRIKTDARVSYERRNNLTATAWERTDPSGTDPMRSESRIGSDNSE